MFYLWPSTDVLLILTKGRLVCTVHAYGSHSMCGHTFDAGSSSAYADSQRGSAAKPRNPDIYVLDV